MPVMNGVVATQHLRHHDIRIPIVAVTGNALSEDVQAFLLFVCVLSSMLLTVESMILLFVLFEFVARFVFLTNVLMVLLSSSLNVSLTHVSNGTAELAPMLSLLRS